MPAPHGKLTLILCVGKVRVPAFACKRGQGRAGRNNNSAAAASARFDHNAKRARLDRVTINQPFGSSRRATPCLRCIADPPPSSREQGGITGQFPALQRPAAPILHNFHTFAPLKKRRLSPPSA